jgi:hypothetical protein
VAQVAEGFVHSFLKRVGLGWNNSSVGLVLFSLE